MYTVTELRIIFNYVLCTYTNFLMTQFVGIIHVYKVIRMLSNELWGDFNNRCFCFKFYVSPERYLCKAKQTTDLYNLCLCYKANIRSKNHLGTQ